ncbi:MAG: DUF4835 family protein [Bacteroidales bacterium]|nr:DUF4835 family protein [Candidatus Liminaster caballi]
MTNILRRMCISALIFTSFIVIKAQELDATVTINAQQIEASFRDRFNTLQTDLQEFINGQQWTGAQFSTLERIQCTFTLTINEMPSNDSFRGSLTVQSRRPVYYSNYQTTAINWKDDQVAFNYTEGQTFTFNEFNLDNELIAIVAYYVYLIIGLDFDSFAPNGGDQYLRKCESIVSQMQGSESKGWKAFDDRRNRHALINALLEEAQSGFRQYWYNYHRLGLDAMYQSVDKGRAQVTNGLELIGAVRKAEPQTPLLGFFISAKLEELVNIYSEAPMTEKQKVYNELMEYFPTYSTRFAKIKEEYKE